MLISKAELQSIIFASNDEHRENISGIHVTETQTIATDGHRMILIDRGEIPELVSPSLEVFQGEDHITLPVTISRESIESVLKAWPKVKKNRLGDAHNWASLTRGSLETSNTKGSLSVIDSDYNLIKFPVNFVLGQYPNFSQVLVNEVERPFRIGVNVRYLADSDYMTKKDNLHTLEIRIRDEKESVLIVGKNAQGQECKQVIMPVRLGEDSVKQVVSDKYNRMLENKGIDMETLQCKLTNITLDDLVTVSDGRQYLKADIEKLLKSN